MKRVKRLLRLLAQVVFIRYAVLRERLESGATFNPLDRSLRANPYPAYRRLREKDPVHRSRMVDTWVLSRYEDIDAVLRDYRRFSNDDRRASDRRLIRSAEVPSMLRLDPPDHTRLRSLVGKAFTPQATERLRPRVEAIADSLLDQMGSAARFDVITALAEPLPVIVIAELLGVPPEDRDKFSAWSYHIERALEPTFTEAEAKNVQQARAELVAYFNGMIELRRKHPSDDLLSNLIVAEDQGARLTRDELISTLILLLVAGNVTTTGLIGNGLLALLQHPDQLQRLRAEPELLESAIEELLRFDSPVHIDSRIAAEDVEIGGKRIRKGQFVLMLLGEANRDPEVYPNPDRLDLGRTGRPHIAFGRGIHHCLGAPLARVEAQAAFQKLLKRYPDLHLDGTPAFGDGVVIRSVKSLTVGVARSPVRSSATPA